MQKLGKEAEDIVKEAENRIISMIDEHEITRKAYEQKAQIIETANETPAAARHTSAIPDTAFPRNAPGA